MKQSVLLLFLILVACNNTASKKDDDRIQVKDTVVVESNSLQSESYDQPINLQEVKSLDNILYTSGVVPHSDTSRFCESTRNGFFGFYILIDKNNDEQIGTLYIHTTDTPENWKSDSQNEKFTSISLFSNDIVIWDSLKVGLTESQLNKFIAKQFHYKKGQTIYSDFGQYEGIFTMRNDSIVKMEIKTNCD